jgi:hypothetical protein
VVLMGVWCILQVLLLMWRVVHLPTSCCTWRVLMWRLVHLHGWYTCMVYTCMWYTCLPLAEGCVAQCYSNSGVCPEARTCSMCWGSLGVVPATMPMAGEGLQASACSPQRPARLMRWHACCGVMLRGAGSCSWAILSCCCWSGVLGRASLLQLLQHASK